MLVTQASTILLAGELGGQPRFVRYLSNGALDSTFGVAGIVTFDPVASITVSSAFEVVEQADGKLVAVGIESSDNANVRTYLTRLARNGSVDTSFGNSGGTLIEVPAQLVTARCLALQSDGRIVVGGFAWDSASMQGYATLLRYWP